MTNGEAAEAKQRRAAATSATDMLADFSVGDPEEKGRRSPLRSFALRLRRRLDDAVATSMLWTSWGLGYAYATEFLLQPAEGATMQCASAICHAAFVLAILSWVGVIYHGPGRVPAFEENKKLPAGIAAALAVGHWNKEHPFGPDDTWCDKCDMWKPALAHHCSICGRCALWMDHHCNFAMSCIGFRNLRCFLLMLFYTQVLCFLFVPLAINRLLRFGLYDFGELLCLAAFGSGWLGLVRFVRHFSRSNVGKATAGWPSQVLLVKYEGIYEVALKAEAQQLERQKLGLAAPALPELQRLLKRLRLRSGGLRGFLRAGDIVSTLSLVFGSKPSWRWLLPLVPGGSGDPLQPTTFDEQVCQDWAALGEVLGQCDATTLADNKACAQAVGFWQYRVEKLLSGAEQKAPSATAAPDWAPQQAAAPPAVAPPGRGPSM